MSQFRIQRVIASVTLVGLLAACGGPAATPQPPTTPPPSSPPPAATTEPSPTGEPTAPQATPTTEPTPSASPSSDASALLPRDRPWVAAGTTIHVPGTSTALDAVTEGDPSTVYQVIAAPDGSAIAYVSQIDGRARLVVRDLRSGEGQVIDSANGDAVAQVRFSPDSQAIAYTILYEQAWQLNVWDRESAASRTLQEGSTPLLGSDGALPFVLFPLAWTPNGLFAERILYATDAPPQGLALVDPQSGEVEIVRESPHLMAAATSDGSSFALMVGERPIPGAPIARIIRFDVADRSETELTPTREQLVQTMAWSPDGTQLLYTTSDSFEGRETTLHLIQADGANERTIAFGQLGLLAPLRAAAWQDASTALVLLWDEAQRFELHALPLSSFDERSLQSLGAFEATLQQGQSPQIVFVP